MGILSVLLRPIVGTDLELSYVSFAYLIFTYTAVSQ
jgi:hypothetical protein